MMQTVRRRRVLSLGPGRFVVSLTTFGAPVAACIRLARYWLRLQVHIIHVMFSRSSGTAVAVDDWTGFLAFAELVGWVSRIAG